MIRRLTQDLFWAAVLAVPLGGLLAAWFGMID